MPFWRDSKHSSLPCNRRSIYSNCGCVTSEKPFRAIERTNPRTPATPVWPMRLLPIYCELRRHLLWIGLRGTLREIEAHDPLAGDASAADFRRNEFPLPHRFQSAVRKIFARTGRLQFRVRNAPGSVNMYAHSDSHGASNGITGLLRNFRDHLIEDLSFARAPRDRSRTCAFVQPRRRCGRNVRAFALRLRFVRRLRAAS